MKIYYFKEIDSTMDMAHNLAEKKVPEGSIVLADIQKKGRGRKGKNWESPEGGLWFSLIFYPNLRKEELNFLPILFGVSVLQGLEKFISVSLTLKWPNDLELNGKKVGGILLESRWENNLLKYLIVGIGINLLVPEEFFKDKDFNATTLLPYLKERNKLVVLEEIWKRIWENYKSFPKNIEEILAYFEEKFPYIEKEVYLHSESSKKVVKILGISKDGSLVVEEDNMIKSYPWGAISVRP